MVRRPEKQCMEKPSKLKSSDSSAEAKELKKAASESIKSTIRAGTVAQIENLS